MIARESTVSGISFILSLLIQIFSITEYGEKFGLLFSETIFSSIYALFSLHFIILIVILSVCFFKCTDFQIAIRAGILGFAFGISLYVAITFDNRFKSFGIYGAFLTMFHFSEYFIISVSNPKSLSLDSFMLTHSMQYGLAAVLSWVEYFVELYYVPEMKQFKTFWIFGAVICVLGEILRKCAIITAGKSFHHIVQFEHSVDHKLITQGVYRICRHPSYVAWFYWSFGTQIILANPICFILYIIASWIFFKERIYLEEIALINFFGADYLRYQQTTPTGLPFIRGYDLDE